ncbi:hypothetical protein [Actinomadura rupiterrae]|uniref:hypothetical protein n=1 Tax=Actinomadura rupiterrae TaxID=559627 RepID=UPI0020A600B5|nr:hypothetical protein [Actinomadura rupiterrae]MCP2336834.1 hypothetical protein [Actinomadura rupiterrae]
MGDDEQEYTTRATERYIEDPPAELVFQDDPDPTEGRIGIFRESGMQYRRGDRRREEDEWDDRPAEVTAVRDTRGNPPDEDAFADDLREDRSDDGTQEDRD